MCSRRVCCVRTGDPVTALTAFEGLVVIGSAAGAVSVWKDDALVATLAASSDEAIRGLAALSAEEVLAVVGDLEIRNWTQVKIKQANYAERRLTLECKGAGNLPPEQGQGAVNLHSEEEFKRAVDLHSEEECKRAVDLHSEEECKRAVDWRGAVELDAIRFDRPHRLLGCRHSFTILNGDVALLVAAGDRRQWLIDLRRKIQRRVEFAVPEFAAPVFFDGNNVVLAGRNSLDRKVMVQVWTNISQASGPEMRLELAFPESKAAYWGFQVNKSLSRMVIVSRQCRIALWDIQEIKKPRKIVGFTAHKSAVLAILVEEHVFGLELAILTLGADRKLKLWNDQGMLKRSYDVLGDFACGYPYILRRDKRSLLYTADDGVYLLDMEIDP